MRLSIRRIGESRLSGASVVGLLFANTRSTEGSIARSSATVKLDKYADSPVIPYCGRNQSH